MQIIPSLSVLFWLKHNKKTAEGTPVYCRITVNGQRAEISMQRYVNPERWSGGQLHGETRDEKEINHYLSVSRSIVHRHFEKMVELGQPITAELLKRKVLGTTERKMTFTEVYNWMLSEFRKKVELGKRSEHTAERFEISLH